MITPINDFDRNRIKNAYVSIYGKGRPMNESVCNEGDDDEVDDVGEPDGDEEGAGEGEEELVSDLTPAQCRRVDKAWHKFLDKVHFEPCVETADGLIYIYFNTDTGVFEYGRLTDDGIIAEGGVAYDMDIPLSENLDNVVDEIHDEYGFPDGEEEGVDDEGDVDDAEAEADEPDEDEEA